MKTTSANSIRNCENCRKQFAIEPDDSQIYEKFSVPPPTFCPTCRIQRRFMFRNDRALYKRACDSCGKSIITVYSPEKPYTVYCNPCWWSDKWEGLDFGRKYDPNRTFFEQYKKLIFKVPYMALVVDYPTMVNSEYSTHAGHMKNCYLSRNADYCENVHYSDQLANVKDSMDSTMLGESELCYGNVNCGKCYSVYFSEDCTGCHDVYFSKSCIGCTNCFGCVNLRNKSHYFFNEPQSKDEYQRKLGELALGSHEGVEEMRQKAYSFWQKAPHKFMHGYHNTNASGDYVYYSKNLRYGYRARYVEDGKYCQLVNMAPAKDLYDYTEWGNNAERCYECLSVGEYVSDVKFSQYCWRANCLNLEYSFYLLSCADCFGCVGLRNKQYCILNTQYTREEYEMLKKQIMKDMNERPYIDARGRVWRYGEFFPYDLSLFDYNETTASHHFPLAKEEALANGFRWRDPSPPEYAVTKSATDVPDHIRDVSDGILEDIIECSTCKRGYRIIRPELDLLRKFGFPLPRKCPNCRYKERFNRVNPPQLWDRACVRCGAAIQTSYAPDRPEIVYCEQCYNSETA